jgi:hypothetical protein
VKSFWNDADGLTVVDILAITLGLGTLLAYWKYGSVDTNYADIVIAALIASAGQKIGLGITRRGMSVTGGETDEYSGDQPQI